MNNCKICGKPSPKTSTIISGTKLEVQIGDHVDCIKKELETNPLTPIKTVEKNSSNWSHKSGLHENPKTGKFVYLYFKENSAGGCQVFMIETGIKCMKNSSLYDFFLAQSAQVCIAKASIEKSIISINSNFCNLGTVVNAY